ncbi:putative RPO21-DNA-directed RNA polymerase II, 215 kd subunit [Tilletiaria anomala UBC 951]|uniref:DNA-directed RNA polymerase subunit n=1 Tax=Tilletiaria anomala (strain ATCC 24038 / CBS 436.72 / UBC 951) TaxID=1037660 RepID=A0A066VMM5_TILAU|nr:putative RPO21-DNA-directed RNA polymerase II, 215 kd subunit [Tilletiaria anomala UBC 951]KDN42992.1 putative RPO21-DNA-directed RNA polymerase II, 215 kd subunit [Tilletiaria anomala UBC 951]
MPSGVSFADSPAPVRPVREVQFGIMSPEEIRAISVMKVEYPETLDETGRTRVGGLMDPRMGTIDRTQKCQTCGEGMAECPGHFAHIDLARPVFHIGFLGKVKKLLEIVCTHCGKVKADATSDPVFDQILKRTRGSRKRRFQEVWDYCSKIPICQADDPKEEDDMNFGDDAADNKAGHGGCGHEQPAIRKEGLKLFQVWKRGKDDEDAEGEGSKSAQPDKRPLTAMEAHSILRKMSSEDIAVVGLSEEFARPDWMILTVLPVPPPQVRPGVTEGGQGTQQAQDDLTYKLAEIIKSNVNVRKFEEEGAPAHIISEFEQLLQFHIATYMDNDIAGMPQAMQKSGRPVKAIRARLKGKEGRLRGNLMGKRVDFSARTVITGDPNLELDEVGVPKSIARNLTYPERVTPYNINYLQQLVRNGPTEWPGARYVVRDTGERIDLKYGRRSDMTLQFGWIVERHLKDGDFVLFNRQPSLHKMSMMCHRVKLMDFSTFRLNLSVTPPYNADFDGDEMNLHVPQSEETRAELSQIAWVAKNIVSPQGNKPVMGIVQDTLCGIRKFTLRDCLLDYDQVQNILLWVPEWDGLFPTPCILKPKPYWSGKQIISMCIPRGVNVSLGDRITPEKNNAKDDGVEIDNGEIMYGVVKKNVVGSSAGGLIHIIFREKGPEICRDFFGGAQRVVNFWLLHNGFSIGIGDTVADAAVAKYITETIATAKREVEQFIDDARFDRMKPEPGMTIRESFETKVNRTLNKARDDVGSRAEKELPDWNNVKQMVIAGSKGSFINISQMSACVGQQSVEGKRIPFGFRHRSLPHFSKDDFSPESRGFVENSYLRGLTPHEFFFHAMAGREGLIDTAVKTAETGYIQRRLVKALEDVMVHYDGTVRNSTNKIIQFIYGEDGMDGAMIERQFLLTHKLNDAEFRARFKVDLHKGGFRKGRLQAGLADWSQDLQTMLDDEFTQLEEDRRLLRFEMFNTNRNDVMLPLNIARLVTNAKQVFVVDSSQPTDVGPAHIIASVREVLEDLTVIRGDDSISRTAQENATLLFKVHLRSYLASKHVIEVLGLNKESFDWVIGEVREQFSMSVANPGEMCGTLAAQSIGEPATQMTLNTFHYAGVSSKNVTLGVPRLKEIINCAENIRTPSVLVYLREQYSQTEESAKIIQTYLTHTTLQTVTSAVEIHYDPNPVGTLIEDDKDFVDAFFAIPDEEVEQTLDKQSPWLLRLVLDRAQMLDKNLSMAEVAGKIQAMFGQDIFVMHSEDNAEQLVLRIRVVNNDTEKEPLGDEDTFLKNLAANMLTEIDLKGVQGIKKVFIVKHEKEHQRINLKTGEWEPVLEWVLDTQGTNLKEVLAVEGVDTVRTVSNNCVEIFNVFGIEAARNSLLREMRMVIEFGGSYVNYRHIGLLVDIMTTQGKLMAITRHGINRTDQGALMRSSFEETVEILIEAAAMGEADDCKGVAENVLLGQMAPMGTGSFDVTLNMRMLQEVIVDHRLPMQALMASRIDHFGDKTPIGMMTPYDGMSPMAQAEAQAHDVAAFSPLVNPTNEENAFVDYLGQGISPMRSSIGGMSPGTHLGAVSPAYGYAPTSPAAYLTSPGAALASPMYQSHAASYSPTSPKLNFGTSPGYSPASPGFSPASPSYSPTSPRGYSPASPQYSPASPSYSPASPSYSPTSPARGGKPSGAGYSPASPAYSPASPAYSPASPAYSPASPAYSPASPAYSPASPAYSPASPSYSPASPQYSPTSPKYSPASPQYSPTSPAGQQPTSPQYSPASPGAAATNGANGSRGGVPPRRSNFTSKSMYLDRDQ